MMATMWTKKRVYQVYQIALISSSIVTFLSSASSHGSVGRVHAQFIITFYCHHSSGGVLEDWITITSAEREVKDSRRSGMSQSWYFWDKIGHAMSVGFRFYSTIWRSESRISLRYLEITSISRKKELLFWLSRGLNRLTCVTRQIRGDSKVRD